MEIRLHAEIDSTISGLLYDAQDSIIGTVWRSRPYCRDLGGHCPRRVEVWFLPARSEMVNCAAILVGVFPFCLGSFEIDQFLALWLVVAVVKPSYQSVVGGLLLL